MNSKPTSAQSEKPVCGLIMPISSIDGCDELHWKDVMAILRYSIESAGYDANLVSNDTDVGVIHKRIVQNIYNNPIVVCDVSGKNPNVMFELGMRLAFDKPVIIVKDDKTPYSFDTSPVEHLTYPRDLRFGAIVEFQAKLADKIKKTSESKNSFLDSFGTFKVAELNEEKAGALDIILDEVMSLKREFRRQEERGFRSTNSYAREDSKLRHLRAGAGPVATISVSGTDEARARAAELLGELPLSIIRSRRNIARDKEMFQLTVDPASNITELNARISAIAHESKAEITVIEIEIV